MVDGVTYVYVNAEKRPSKTAKNAGERSLRTKERSRVLWQRKQVVGDGEIPRGELRIVTLRLRYVAAEVGGIFSVIVVGGVVWYFLVGSL